MGGVFDGSGLGVDREARLDVFWKFCCVLDCWKSFGGELGDSIVTNGGD